MPRVQLEVCVETVEDAVAAEAGGADRLELCSRLREGGLTPTLQMYSRVRRKTRLPVAVMLRPYSNGFVVGPRDHSKISETLERFLPLAPAGVVFGHLTPDRRIDTATAAWVRRLCGSIPAVFHRAFDEIADKPAALEELIRLGFTRVLTSGGPGSVPQHLPELRKLVEQAAGRIQVMPGGGVRAEAAAGVVQSTGCEHLHGSFSEPHGRGRRTSRAAVAAARAAVDQPGGTGRPMASG
jgi:copper homeostasis protein